MRLGSGFIGGVLAVLMGSTAPETLEQGQAAIDGMWAGQTSQEKTISFNIERSEITWFALDWTLPLQEICASSPGSPIGVTQTGGQDKFFFYPNSAGSEPPKITYPTFKLTRAVGGALEKVQMVLTAQFSSSSELTGTLDLTASGCKGSEKLKWQAKRKLQ